MPDPESRQIRFLIVGHCFGGPGRFRASSWRFLESPREAVHKGGVERLASNLVPFRVTPRKADVCVFCWYLQEVGHIDKTFVCGRFFMFSALFWGLWLQESGYLNLVVLGVWMFAEPLGGL